MLRQFQRSAGDQMKYGICNETFGDWPLEKALQLASETGYTGWEVAPFMLTDNVRTFDAASRRAYRRAVESAGFEIIGLHWLLAKTTGLHLTTHGSHVRQRTSDYLRGLVDLCADLGGDVMVLGSPQQRNVPERPNDAVGDGQCVRRDSRRGPATRKAWRSHRLGAAGARGRELSQYRGLGTRASGDDR